MKMLKKTTAFDRGRDQGDREARAGRDSGTEIVKVPLGDYTSARHQMCLLKRNTSSSSNAGYPLMLYIDHSACLSVSQAPTVSPERDLAASEEEIGSMNKKTISVKARCFQMKVKSLYQMEICSARQS